MRMLHANELSTLLAAQPGPCVSMYLDTKSGDRDPQTIRRQWKGLLEEADSVIRGNFQRHKARFLLEPMREVPEVLSNPPRGSEAIALFRSFTTAGYYPVREAAPRLVTVADTFHLKPLLKVIQEQEKYFALALSQRRISLYRGNREGLWPIASYQADYGEPSRKRASPPKSERIDVPRGKEGRNAALQFRPLSRVARFTELTEPLVASHLHRERSPLLAVGTPFMHRLYRKSNGYPYLSDQGVLASLPHDRELLHKKTWPLAEGIFLRREMALCESFFEERQRDKASDDLEEIARASIQGRVSSLLISRQARLFGALDRDKGRIELRRPASGALGDDVLDDLAQEVILRRGQAYVLPEASMPTASPIAAVFRW